MEFGPQPGDLVPVAQPEHLEPAYSPGDPVVDPYLLGNAPGGGACQQISLVFMRQG